MPPVTRHPSPATRYLSPVTPGKDLGYFDRRGLGETTLRSIALDLQSEDYESEKYKPLEENPCCYPSRRCFIDTFTT